MTSSTMNTWTRKSPRYAVYSILSASLVRVQASRCVLQVTPVTPVTNQATNQGMEMLLKVGKKKRRRIRDTTITVITLLRTPTKDNQYTRTRVYYLIMLYRRGAFFFSVSNRTYRARSCKERTVEEIVIILNKAAKPSRIRAHKYTIKDIVMGKCM